MSAIKDGKTLVELNGRKYSLLFSLNALDEMQDRFGGYDKLDKAFDKNNPDMIKDLRWLLTLIINEGLEDDEQMFTEKQIGKMIHLGNLNQIKNAIFNAFAYSVNGEELKEGAESETKEENEETGELKAGQE